MRDLLWRGLGKLPLFRSYRRALETAFDVMGPEGRREYRKRVAR